MVNKKDITLSVGESDTPIISMVNKNAKDITLSVGESNTPIISFEKLVVRQGFTEEVPAAKKTYDKISVFCKKKPEANSLSTGVGGKVFLITDTSISDYVDVAEILEIQGKFVDEILLFNETATIENLEASYPYAIAYGDFAIMTKSVSAIFLPATKTVEVPFLLLLSDSGTTLSDDKITAMNTYGMMIDTSGEGKALFALSHMLSQSSQVAFSNQVTNSVFQGIVLKTEADILDENGISCWAKTKEKTYPFSFQIKKEQVFKLANDKRVLSGVREAVASFINAGHRFTSPELALLETSISVVLKTFVNFFDSPPAVTVKTIDNYTTQERKSGKVTGVIVRYSVAGEIRIVELII